MKGGGKKDGSNKKIPEAIESGRLFGPYKLPKKFNQKNINYRNDDSINKNLSVNAAG
ncbi:MAG: hypothetical protein K2I96_22540 [Lachnospiraceae bacterium]|nr:hypothetical protein [Lachnospiraceae bacterium]